MPKAIILALLIGGGIFLTAAWFTQSLFPDISGFTEESLENSALPQIAFEVGGQLFKILLTAAAFAATVASSLASQSSVSRLLYVMMGRNGHGPVGRFFGYIHPTFQTPAYAIIFTGFVSLFAIGLSLDFVASLINFGALIAFTFVNLTVIVYFAYRRRETHTRVRFSATSCYRDRRVVDRAAVVVPFGGVDPLRHDLVRHRHHRAAVDHAVLQAADECEHGEEAPITREG